MKTKEELKEWAELLEAGPLEWVEDDIDDCPELQAEQDEAILWNVEGGENENF